MQSELVDKLLRLNQEFYATYAQSFAATRHSVQPGVQRLLPQINQAEVVLDMAIDIMPGKNFPYNISFLRSYNELSLIDMMEQYLMIGKSEKAIVLADQFVEETLQMAKFFATSYGSSSLSTKEMDSNVTLLYYVINIFERYDQKEFANSVKRRLVEL